MALNIYLNFDGDCAAAFDFYKSVFGGDFTVHSTFAEAPPDIKFDPTEGGRIMHVSLPVGGAVLMGSDVARGFGEPHAAGNNFSISYSPDTREEADRAFGALSDGGAVVMAMDNTFWGSYFGLCKDKFGIQWMVNVDLGEK